MRLRGLVLVLGALLVSCSGVNGACCNDGDCLGTAICSSECASNGGKQGICLTRCQVDADCSAGKLCQEFDFGCACEAPADGGTVGTCPQG
jgi:hypothetical protein